MALAVRSGLEARLFTLGEAIRRRRGIVALVQWSFVLLYLALLLAPLLLPEGWAALAARVAKLEELLFWGIWWPGVILSTLLFGQIWCGLFCPDGTMSEAASQHGMGRKPASWLRAGEWPLLGFALITLAGEVGGAHRSPLGTLAIVGGASALGVAIGLIYGRSKRIFCRYLCPLAGLFSWLARCAVLHFKVDRATWDAAPRPPAPVECPLLLDVRRLIGNEKCNMCARCSGYRGAVALSFRAPGAEIAAMRLEEARRADALGIAFLLIGLGYCATGWRDLPGFADLAARDSLAVALASVLTSTLLIGSLTLGALLLATRGVRQEAYLLSYALIPLAGLGLAAGALEHTLHLLARPDWLPAARLALVVPGGLWSLKLGWPLAPAPFARLVFTTLVFGLSGLYLHAFA